MYITRDDLDTRFGKNEIDRLATAIREPDAVQKAIDDAVQAVESYVASRYDLPLPIVPVSLQRACAVIARYYLYKNQPTETVRQDYEDITRWLEQVASGKVKLVLGLPAGEESPTANYLSGMMIV